MLPAKRGYSDLTTFLDETKRSCRGGGEEASDWISGDMCRDNPNIWSDNLCKSVVSIALSDGRGFLFASSGIAIECKSNFTKVVTSANLVRALDDVMNGREDLKIIVRHGGNVSRGFLEKYDMDHEMAVVKVTSILDVYCLPLNHEVMPYGKMVTAVGRDIDGTLMTKVGKLTGSSESEDSECPMFSTCQLSEVMLGGALFGFDGTFLGMNLFSDMERTIFLPRSTILGCLIHLQPSWQKKIIHALAKPIRYKKRHPGAKLHSHCEGSRKVNTSEDSFGDEYPSGIWGKFRNEVSSNISANVVALASFYGGIKFFACTGFFIKYDEKIPTILTSASLVRDPDGGNKIFNSLMIKVLLPDKTFCEGKLEHYSLHYNVALISVKNYNVTCPANLEHNMLDYSIEVVAVGRCFESSSLMAANGDHTNYLGDLEDESFGYTTCKATKVGIGGPLVDLNGKYIGMNYYGTKGTPLMYCDDLCGLLNYFRTKETKYWRICREEVHIVEDDEEPTNIWIIPDSIDNDKDELDSSDMDEDEFED